MKKYEKTSGLFIFATNKSVLGNLCYVIMRGSFLKRRYNVMQILVDADACPVKQIIVRLAKQKNIPVTMLIDTSHELNDGYSTVITVDKQADSVDYALMRLLTREDIVVTQDFGLAAMVIGKGARAINQNGMVFTDENMDRLLMERHIGQKVRRGGGRTKGPAKRTKENDAWFEAAFERLLTGCERIAVKETDEEIK
jgi:uncharacterized protein YaiI (UPF0178 family)